MSYPFIRCLKEPEWKKKKINHEYVRNGKYEFTKVVEINGALYQAGTQKIDGIWGNIKDYFVAKHGVPHEAIPAHMRFLQWRHLMRGEDPVSSFATVVKRCVEMNLLRE